MKVAGSTLMKLACWDLNPRSFAGEPGFPVIRSNPVKLPFDFKVFPFDFTRIERGTFHQSISVL